MTTRNRFSHTLGGASLLALGLALTFATMPIALAGSYDDDAAQAKQDGRLNVSTWVDADWGFRKRGAANELNRAHQAYAAHGFEVLDVDPYIENGDLQGFFVTYRKR